MESIIEALANQELKTSDNTIARERERERDQSHSEREIDIANRSMLRGCIASVLTVKGAIGIAETVSLTVYVVARLSRGPAVGPKSRVTVVALPQLALQLFSGSPR